MEIIYLSKTMIFILKIAFIFFLFLIQMYLIFSHSHVVTPIKEMQSGFNIKKLKYCLSFLGGVTGYFATMIAIKNEIKDTKLNNLNKLLEEERNNIRSSIDKGKEEHQKILDSINRNREDLFKIYNEKNKITAHTDRLLTIHNNIKDKVISFDKKSLDGGTRLSELGIIDQLIIQDAKKFRDELTDLLNNLDIESQSTSTTTNDTPSSETEIKESNIFPFDLNILKNLLLEFETLSGLHKLAVSMLLCKSVVFSASVSIIFIFYGNILLEKYDIKNRYPKLAKLIELRQKFQKYYLNYYIALILLVVITEVTFAVAILLL